MFRLKLGSKKLDMTSVQLHVISFGILYDFVDTTSCRYPTVIVDHITLDRTEMRQPQHDEFRAVVL